MGFEVLEVIWVYQVGGLKFKINTDTDLCKGIVFVFNLYHKTKETG